MVEGGDLESRCGSDSTRGSNPRFSELNLHFFILFLNREVKDENPCLGFGTSEPSAKPVCFWYSAIKANSEVTSMASDVINPRFSV